MKPELHIEVNQINIGISQSRYMDGIMSRFYSSIIRYFLIVIIALLIFFIIHLFFGSCQTTKFHYIVQCYYYPKSDYGIIEAPPNYNGTWQLWRKNGIISSKLNYKNGVVDGEVLRWHDNGVLAEKDIYTDGLMDGKFFKWDTFGHLIKVTTWKKNELIKIEEVDSESNKLVKTWEKKDGV